MFIHLIRWNPEVKNKKQLQKAVNELYRSLAEIYDLINLWECHMIPPLIFTEGK
jgi:hypothetical protein